MAFLSSTCLFLADSQSAITSTLTAPHGSRRSSGISKYQLEKGNENEDEDGDNKTLGGLISLTTSPGTIISWRLSNGLSTLELRKLFLLDTAPFPEQGDENLRMDTINIVRHNLSDFGTSPKNKTNNKKFEHIDLDNKPFEISLPDACLPSLSIFEVPGDNTLHIIFVTISGLYYRLILSSNSLWKTPMKVECFQIKSLKNRIPISATSIDICNTFINTNEGTLIHLERAMPSSIIPKPTISSEPSNRYSTRTYLQFSKDKIDYLEHELQDASFLDRIGKFFSSFTNKRLSSRVDNPHETMDNAISSTAVTLDDSLEFLLGLTLTKSGHIRVWDLINKNVKASIFIPYDHLTVHKGDETMSSLALTETSHADHSNRPLLASEIGNFIKVLLVRYDSTSESLTKEEKQFTNLLVYIAVYIPNPVKKIRNIVLMELKFEYGGSGALESKIIGEMHLPDVYDGEEKVRQIVDFAFVPKPTNESQEEENINDLMITEDNQESIIRDDVRSYSVWLLFEEYDEYKKNPFSVVRSDVELNLDSQSVDVTDVPLISTQWIYTHSPEEIDIFVELEIESTDIPAALRSIFIPGKYSENVIKKSLLEYNGKDVFDHIVYDSDIDSDSNEWECLLQYTILSLRTKLSTLCKGQLVNIQHEAFYQELEKFIQICNKYRRIEKTPYSLVLNPSTHFCSIVTNDQIEFLRESDLSEIFNSYISEDAEDDTDFSVLDQIKNYGFSSENIEYSKVFIRLIKLFNENNSINGSTRTDILRFIKEPSQGFNFLDKKSLLTTALLDIFGKPNKNKDIISSNIEGLISTIHLIIRFLSSDTFIESRMGSSATLFGFDDDIPYLQAARGSTTDYNKATLTGRALFCRAFADISLSRYRLIQNIIIAYQIIYSSASSIVSIKKELEDLVTSYTVLNVISNLRISSVNDNETKLFSNYKQDSNLSLISDSSAIDALTGYENLSNAFIKENISCELSLVELMMKDMLNEAQAFRVSSSLISESITNGGLYYMKKFSLLPGDKIDNPSQYILGLAKFLFRAGQYEALYYLGNLLPPDSSFNYLKGRSFLSSGLYDTAKRFFIVASSSVEKPNSAIISLLPESIIGISNKITLADYFVHIAQLFEKCNQPKSVIQFTKMAEDAYLKHYGSFTNIDSIDSRGLYLKSEISGLFFRNCLISNDYLNAYKSLIMIEDKRERLIKLRQFVGVLCKNNRISDICGKYSELQGEVENELINRAHSMTTNDIIYVISSNSNIKEDALIDQTNLTKSVIGSSGSRVINYFEILYNYYSYSYKTAEAARTMYEFGSKIYSIICEQTNISQNVQLLLLEQLSSCYLISYEKLKSLTTDNAFFKSKDHYSNSYSVKSKRKRLFIEDSTTYSDEGTYMWFPEDLRKLYLLTEAKIEFINDTLNISLGLPTPQSAYSLYIQNGKYDKALEYGLTFDLNLNKLFETIAKSCIFSDNQNDNLIKLLPLGWNGDIKTKSWRLIESFIEKIEDPFNKLCYIKELANFILKSDPLIQLPMWIIKSFEKKSNNELLSIYIRHSRFKEAVDVAIRILDSQGRLLDNLRTNNPLTNTPVGLIDRLSQMLNDKQQHERLQHALGRYLTNIKSLEDHRKRRLASQPI